MYYGAFCFLLLGARGDQMRIKGRQEGESLRPALGVLILERRCSRGYSALWPIYSRWKAAAFNPRLTLRIFWLSRIA